MSTIKSSYQSNEHRAIVSGSDETLPFLDGNPLEPLEFRFVPADPRAGVVDEDVDVTEVGKDPIHGGPNLVTFRDVEAVGTNRKPRIDRRFEALRDALSREIGRGDAYALLRQHATHGRPEIASGARHERHTVFKLQNRLLKWRFSFHDAAYYTLKCSLSKWHFRHNVYIILGIWYHTTDMGNKRLHRKVIIALILYNQNGRNQLNGILDYIQKTRAWMPSLVYTREDLAAAIEEADPTATAGFILGGLAEDDLVIRALGTGIPCALIDKDESLTLRARSKFVHITSDNAGIAEVAADYLCSLGDFRSFGYVRNFKPRCWCREREKAFCDFLTHRNCRVSVFKHLTSADDRERRLVRWMDALPKPAAILTACDQIAVQVHDICVNADIRIPDQVSLLGIDNDLFFCESTETALSSIPLCSEELGRAAARDLTDLIVNPRIRSGHFRIIRAENTVVVRESTKPTTPSANLIRRAFAYIDKNAVRGIDASDVARYLGVSRRLMDKRFQQLVGTTVLANLVERRLNEACRLLRKTNRPFEEIALAAGFRSYNRLAKTFRDHLGETLSDYRTRHKPS